MASVSVANSTKNFDTRDLSINIFRLPDRLFYCLYDSFDIYRKHVDYVRGHKASML